MEEKEKAQKERNGKGNPCDVVRICVSAKVWGLNGAEEDLPEEYLSYQRQGADSTFFGTVLAEYHAPGCSVAMAQMPHGVK